MSEQCLLTIDQGTSSTKTALWTRDGTLVAEAAQSYALHRPTALQAEIDANLWWDALCQTTRQVIAKSGIEPQRVAALGADGIGWTLVAVDKQVTPLYPALTWLDRRAVEESAWLQALPEARALINLCANPLDPAYITPKLLWLKRHQPEIFDATYQFLTATGFLVARLTGEFTCDYTQAYGYHFFDIQRERWDEDVAKQLGIPLVKFPRLAPCTGIAGLLTAAAAAQLGLSAGIPVIVGCLDAAAGALGAGVTRVGQTNEQGGQAGGMAISLDHVVVEPQLIFSHHALPHQYLLQGGTVGGGALNWFRELLGASDDTTFEKLSAQAAQTRAGANGVVFIPYMAGERTPLWSNHARGVFFGLSYANTRGDLVRAIMEGCAFAVYHNIQVAAERGVMIQEFLGSGGATASATWCQIKADVYGKPFIVAQRADGGEGGHTLGLFALTAHALGWCDDIGACVERLLPRRKVFAPHAARHAFYQELFEVYLSVSRKLLPDFERMARIEKDLDESSGPGK